MCANVSAYSRRNTTLLLPREAVDSGRVKSAAETRRRFSVETLTSPVSVQSARPADAANNQSDRSSDVLTVSLAVVSLFLVVLLVCFSVAVVVVFCRFDGRRGGYDRRSPTQKCLLSDGENGDGLSTAASTKHSGTDDVSSKFYTAIKFFFLNPCFFLCTVLCTICAVWSYSFRSRICNRPVLIAM